MKVKIITAIKQGLSDLGYNYVKDNITGAQGLFIKKVDNDCFLTLGLTISRYYESKFTASFYLSKTTIWAATWGDIPINCYKRVGSFLDNKERIQMLPQEFHNHVGDAWWHFNGTDSVNSFIQTVGLTESRFVAQPGLIEAIRVSRTIGELYKLSRLTIDQMKFATEFDYKYLPSKEIDGIPTNWFKAAERVITTEGKILNANTVKRLAGDAYRMYLYS